MPAMYRRFIDPASLVGLPETIEEYLEGPHPAVSLAFNPFGSLLATGCQDGQVLIWDYETRGVARTFVRHAHPVTSLLWTRAGRTLFTACAGGVLARWDVLAGAVVKEVDVGGRGVAHLSAPSASWGPDALPALVSFAQGPALLLDLRWAGDAGPGPSLPLPAVALDGDGRGARVLTGAPAAAGGQLAVFSPAGDLVAATCQGVLSLLRCVRGAGGGGTADGTAGGGAAAGPAGIAALEVLEAVKLQGLPAIIGLEFDPAGRLLLVSSQDKSVRVFELADDLAGGRAAGAARRAYPLEELQKLASPKFPKLGSLLHAEPAPAGGPRPPLRLVRRFEAQVETAKWGPSRFSPDGEHVVSAVGAPGEHVVYTWHVPHGYPESTLQGGRDEVAALTWHPDQAPLQLLALGRSGRIYVWTKILTQQWSAFAPDFEDLVENREHIETETEFDTNPAEEDAADAEAADAAAADSAGSDVDVDTWDEPLGAGEVWGVPEIDGEAPLLTLPVPMPSEAVAESEEAAPEAAPGAVLEAAPETETAAPEAVDGEGGAPAGEGGYEGPAAMEEDGEGGLSLLLAERSAVRTQD